MAKRKIDKESYSYYKILYRANKKRAIQRGYDEVAPMLTEGEWNKAHDMYGDSNSDIVDQQTHRFTRKVSEAMWKEMGLGGKRRTFERLTAEEKEQWWAKSKEVYKQMRESGLSGTAAKELMSQMLYGSQ